MSERLTLPWGAAPPFWFDRRRRRLWVNCPYLDLSDLRCLMQQAHQEGLFPKNLDAIVYEMPDVTFMLRGANLSSWLARESGPPRAHD